MPALAVLGFALLAAAPLWLGAYGVGLLIGMTGYVTLASAWALFSGRTGYVSLATVPFFGVGAYAVAVLSEQLPCPLVLLVAALAGLALTLVVGLATLRLAGVYFVVLTFGLAELVRQLVTFYETDVTGTLGRYIFLSVTPAQLYWQLLALCAVTLLATRAIDRSRWGLALRAIADDEVVPFPPHGRTRTSSSASPRFSRTWASAASSAAGSSAPVSTRRAQARLASATRTKSGTGASPVSGIAFVRAAWPSG
jgi:branched-chain amino acid transport system permease protein